MPQAQTQSPDATADSAAPVSTRVVAPDAGEIIVQTRDLNKTYRPPFSRRQIANPVRAERSKMGFRG